MLAEQEKITEDIRQIESYINATWGQFTTKKEVRLRELFPEPGLPGLRHIWKYGSADLVVFYKGTPVCIIEAGGGQHFEIRQGLNDRRKWKLAERNGVRCLNMVNGIRRRISKRQWRNLLGRYIFGCKQDSVGAVRTLKQA